MPGPRKKRNRRQQPASPALVLLAVEMVDTANVWLTFSHAAQQAQGITNPAALEIFSGGTWHAADAANINDCQRIAVQFPGAFVAEGNPWRLVGDIGVVFHDNGYPAFPQNGVTLGQQF